jgi:uncharacterized GH25 family protein
MKKHLLATFCSALIVLPFSAQAHLYWIEPNEFFFYEKTKQMDKKVSEDLSFEISGGDTYFNADSNRTVDEAAYTFTYLKPDGSPLSPAREFNSPQRRIIETSVDSKGTYTLAVTRSGKPMYYSKLADDSWVAKAKDELTDDQMKGAKVFGGYFQHIKSYVTLHTPTDSWQKPLGHALEIVPLSHPNLVYSSDSLKVKVLYMGKPVKDTHVSAIYQGFRAKEHGKTPISVKTDETGVATLTFSQPSRWLITTKYIEKQGDNKKADLFEHQASLMLEVNEHWVKQWTE